MFGTKQVGKKPAAKKAAPKKAAPKKVAPKKTSAPVEAPKKGGAGYRRYEGEALWLPNTTRPAWLDGSLPGVCQLER